VKDGSKDVAAKALDALARGPIWRLWRRVVLTWCYHGPWSVAFRIATFPLRATPLGHRLGFGSLPDVARSTARSWYRRSGRPVVVVIPSYRDAALVTRLVRSIRRTTHRGNVQIIVSDDCSGPEHLSRLRRIRGIKVIESDSTQASPQPRTGACGLPTGRSTSSCSTRTWSRGVTGSRSCNTTRSRLREWGSSAQSSCTGRANPVCGDGAQSSRAAVVRSSLPLQAGALWSGLGSATGAGCDGSMHVHQPGPVG